MKKLNKILNYFIWIPFAVSIGAFVLYFRYFLQMNFAANTVITAQVGLIMDRYLKVGLFSLFIGLLVLLINKISKLVFDEDKYYEENHPWMKQEESTLKDEIIKDETLEDINNKNIKDILVEDKKEDKIIIKENTNSDNNISKDLKSNKILKARFIDNNKEEKMIEILTDEEEEIEVLSLDNVVLMPEVKRQTVIKIDSSKVRIDGFRKCPKCNNFIVEEAVICVHCGILLDESLRGKIDGVMKKNNLPKKDSKNKKKNKKEFNIIKFLLNITIIALSFLAIVV